MEPGRNLPRLIELVILFALLPLLLLSDILPRPWILYLFVASVPLVVWLRVARRFTRRDFWSGRAGPDTSVEVVRIVARFGVNSIGIVALTFVLFPDRLLEFPASEPLRWVAVLVGYPLVMVYPQELVFRAFFSERYAVVLGSRKWVLLINGILFGWVHILYGNWVAVVLSGVGGVLFMDTYLRTRSLRLVCLEHALYGNLIFTVGLGEFFYSGWAG